MTSEFVHDFSSAQLRLFENCALGICAVGLRGHVIASNFQIQRPFIKTSDSEKPSRENYCAVTSATARQIKSMF